MRMLEGIVQLLCVGLASPAFKDLAALCAVTLLGLAMMVGAPAASSLLEAMRAAL